MSKTHLTTYTYILGIHIYFRVNPHTHALRFTLTFKNTLRNEYFQHIPDTYFKDTLTIHKHNLGISSPLKHI